MPPHGGQDAGVPLIAVNGIELYYESRGTGAPLLVLGGLGLDVSEMGMLTGPLAVRFRVIAADNRGTGRSAKPPGPYSIDQMAADVAGLMDRLELQAQPDHRARPHRARHVRPRDPGRHGQADARSDARLPARPDRRRPPGPAAHPARTARRRGQRVPDGKRLTAYRSPGCGPGTNPRVVTGATGRPDARS